MDVFVSGLLFSLAKLSLLRCCEIVAGLRSAMANCLPPVVVRISESEAAGEGKDWLVPGEVSFRMVLVSVKECEEQKININASSLG